MLASPQHKPGGNQRSIPDELEPTVSKYSIAFDRSKVLCSDTLFDFLDRGVHHLAVSPRSNLFFLLAINWELQQSHLAEPVPLQTLMPTVVQKR